MANKATWVYALITLFLFSCTDRADMEARERHAQKAVEEIGEVLGISCTPDKSDCGPGSQCVAKTDKVVVVLSCKNQGCSISSVTGVKR